MVNQPRRHGRGWKRRKGMEKAERESERGGGGSEVAGVKAKEGQMVKATNTKGKGNGGRRNEQRKVKGKSAKGR